MQQWKYKYVQVALELGALKGIKDDGVPVNLSGYNHHIGYLNRLGAQGWELVGVIETDKEH